MDHPHSKTGQPRNSKLYVAGGLLILLAGVVFAQQAFNLSFISYSRPGQNVLLFTLSTSIFVVLLVFAFIFLRTLVKTWDERKQGKPGSRFKTSLLGMLILLTLLPAISVFAYAYGLVNRSIDRWFGAPITQVFNSTDQVELINAQAQQQNAQAIFDYLGANPPADVDQARRLLHLKVLIEMDGEGRIVAASAEPGIPVDRFGQNAMKSLSGIKGTLYKQDGDWVGVRRIETPGGEKILAGVAPTRRDLAKLAAEINLEQANYDRLKKENALFRNIYGLILALMTVLVLFATVWVGLFLSKKVTEPIEALAAATREISAGNLGHRVDVKAADELGMLVDSFNRMASQLQGTTEELETRRHYIEVVLESVPTGVISLDADFRIHTLNRAARTMFGAGNATRLEDIFKGEELQEILALLADAGEIGVTRDISFRSPGRPAHSAVTVTRLVAGGFVVVVEDLTEFVRAQRASAWRDVARRLAHEIKNPLTPIQLSAERIMRNISRVPAAPPRVLTVMHECVGAIINEVSSLKHLVDEFVRFARLPTVSRVPESMRELVDRTVALYEGRMDGVTMQVNISEDLPPILMDSGQMKRVLVNLIDNAMEALSGQDERSLRIACELARDGTMARLTVEDTGAGILPEDRERLFTPYFSTRKDGTGLGLSIASRIVSDHGGYIGAEPNSPRGTRFIIELPVCQESSLSTTSQGSGSL
jgi:two-component system, NtrC family, nitrogen regulation sensor histidine kinase NtrY